MTPLNLIDHAAGSLYGEEVGRSCVMTLDPAIAGRMLSIGMKQVRLITKAEVHFHDISMWMQTLK